MSRLRHLLLMQLLLLLFLPSLFFVADAQPGNSAQAIGNDSLMRIIHENKQDLAECKAWNTLADKYSRTDVASEKSCLWRAMDLAERLHEPEQTDVAYVQMVTAELETGHPDSATYFLGLLKKLADEKACAVAGTNYTATAGLFYKMQSNYRAAIPFMMASLNEGLEKAKKNPTINARTAVAGQNLNIGNTYASMGEYKNALQYHLRALQLFEEVNNKRGISFSYQGIGADFLQLAQFKQARAYTEMAIAIKTELGDQRGIATSLKQTGDVELGLKDYDSAFYYYTEALKIYRNVKLTTEEANVSTDIGQLFVLKNDPANARLYYQQGRVLALQVGDSPRVAAIDAALIGLQTNLEKEKRVEKSLINTLQSSIEAGDMNSQLLNYKYLADHYASMHQTDKAVEYLNKYYLVSDSLMNINIQTQMKRLEQQYNLDKKEQEIALLKKDQELTHLSLQKQKAFQLGAVGFLVLLILIAVLIVNRYRIVHKARRAVEMEKMRNGIARDLHDDIGSTLTSINVLSNMALQTEEKDEAVMRTNLQKIRDRSSAIMDSMGDIVWAINPQNDTMEQLLFRMKEFAVEILEPLNIHYSFEEEGDFSTLRLDIRKRKDFYLLFKEALNNAAKYSRCRNLQIRFIQRHQKLLMEIIDDGTGFVENEVRNGNGLNNMRERAASMAGEIRIDPQVGKGTRIAVDLPIT
jgi:two-component system, NarL family, sensor histidine kinase UhpB